MQKQVSSLLLGSLETTRLTLRESRFLSQKQPSGVTLFRRNILSPERHNCQDLALKIQSTRGAGPPMIIAIDQEGGRVARLKEDFPDEGPPFHLLPKDTSRKAQDYFFNYGKRLGRALVDCGINVNFAPVVDIMTPETSDAIGDRVFGSTHQEVTLRAGAFLRGQNQFVGSCLKHFPGQGRAPFDTHFHSTKVPVTYRDLEQEDLQPYKVLLQDASMVMISHCIYEGVDCVEATRSSFLLSEVLRKRYKYKGLIVSDDLTMKAVNQDVQQWCEFLLESVVAGCDLLLVCKEFELWVKAYEFLLRKCQQSPFISRVIADRSERVYQMRKKIS